MSTASLQNHRQFVQAARIWAVFNGFLVVLLGAPIVFLFSSVATAAARREGSAILGSLVAAIATILWWNGLRSIRRGMNSVSGPKRDSDRHWIVATKALRKAVARTSFMVAVGIALNLLAIYSNGRRSDALAVFAAIWDAFFLFIFMGDVFGGSSLLCDVAVVPYFERRVGEIDTFCRGKSLARRMNEIDAQARALELTPLSDFGWNDDLAGELLVWHEPAEGLATVHALLAFYQDDPAAEHNLIDDLKSLAQALASAEAKAIRFCLLLRHGDVTSGQEWDARKGTCF